MIYITPIGGGGVHERGLQDRELQESGLLNVIVNLHCNFRTSDLRNCVDGVLFIGLVSGYAREQPSNLECPWSIS